MKNKVINKVKWKFINFSNKYYRLPNLDYTQKIAYVLGVSNHPNAGDQEITLAQKKFINKYFPNYQYVEIEKEKTIFIISELRKRLKPDDIVFIQGGGTLSDLYPEHEVPRQILLKELKDSPCKIVQFPVSFYYEDFDKFRASKSIYNSVKNLTIFARESKSLSVLKSELSVPVLHVPDIVLSQDESSNQPRNNDVVIMFRSDKECVLPQSLANSIVNHFSKSNNIILTDNYVKDYVLTFEKNRDRLLKEKFEEFRHAKLIITDRLHGMIFAYITKTPAIVFDNSYGKVKHSFENWLSDSKYIKFIEGDDLNLENVIKIANELVNTDKEFVFNVEDVFEPLINITDK